MRLRLPLALLLLAVAARAQDRPPLTVDQIMQRPETWIGAWPGAPYWTDDGAWIYFEWNPRGRFEADSLFRVRPDGGEPVLVSREERRSLPPPFAGWHADRLAYDASSERRVFDRDGDLFLYDLDADRLTRLTRTLAGESDPHFTPDGRRVVYHSGGVGGGPPNLFALDLETGATEQLTDLRSGSEEKDEEPSAQGAYLEAQQLRLFDVLRERARRDSLREAIEEQVAARRGWPPAFYTEGKSVQQLRLDPTGRFVTFVLATEAEATETRLVDYVTRSGYAEEITARPKVGSPSASEALWVQDLRRDTSYAVDLTALPGAYDPADYRRARGEAADSTRIPYAFGPYWSPDGRFAVLDVRTRDNKDRWIARLDPETGAVTSLDRQRDEAWIAGPGISWWGGESSVGWMADGRRFWFQSEKTGYSHLYTVDVANGAVTALTSGAFEVSEPVLSKDGQTWYFLSSEGSPFERHVYRMPAGGVRERLTSAEGRSDFALSPGEEHLALLHSPSHRPPEVYAQPVRPGAEAERLTTSPTEGWLAAHPWREAEIVHVPASDGAEVPARLYRPEAHGAMPNGAAVLFVHGAGYLQNVHRWWSSYFREWMFHHLLAERGYLVLDLDYRASEGYGRGWRTAVYRHMGGRDLQDYVDASRWVGSEFAIAPERVAIYGGSYGGFITLMALFTEPEHFGGGAALRSVTDWAHYNHAYTANILNTPAADSLAYTRSSPIEFAAGLEDPLLMAHGLVDDNVQPQDIFRLTQRLIELRKEDWELALYPVEPHGFREPTSWADEYRRILDLIEHSVGPQREADETEG